MARQKGSFRGIGQNHEINPAQFRRDTRRFSTKFAASVSELEALYLCLGIAFGLGFFIPALIPILTVIIIAFYLYWRRVQIRREMPFRYPKQARRKDPGDLAPGSYKQRDARGIFCLGNDLSNGQEVWLDNDYARRHLMMLGTTGAGKSEALKGMAANALSWGSGFIGVDGKADTTLVASFLALIQRFGRQDDVLVLNFMTGGQDVRSARGAQSNTLNPLKHGSTSELQELFASLMSEGGSGGSGDMWKDRAKVMNDSLLFPLVYLRDRGDLNLSISHLRHYMELEHMVELANREDIPLTARQPLLAYLASIPGFDKSKGSKQEKTALDQHGYLVMQFTRILGSLSDSYGHIFNVDLGDIDFTDVVLNRRILLVLLPALEKSPAELANLGKIVIASLKAMMSKALGNKLEGDSSEIIETKPTNSDSPFFVFLDEVGYYTTPGMAVLPAQGRSLGFSFLFAAQDIPGLYKGGKDEALSILGNTATWIIGKVRDVEETKKFVMQAAGQTRVAHSGGFSMQAQGLSRTYHDTMQATLTQEDRINWQDIQDQAEGEVHFLLDSKIIRGSTLYVEPEPLKELRLNRFLALPPVESDTRDIQDDVQKAALVDLLKTPARLRKKIDGVKRPLLNDQLASLLREKSADPALCFAQLYAPQLKHDSNEHPLQGLEALLGQNETVSLDEYMRPAFNTVSTHSMGGSFKSSLERILTHLRFSSG